MLRSRVIQTAAQRATTYRSIHTTRVQLQKASGPVETAKKAAEKVNHVAGDAAVKGIELGQAATQKAKEATGLAKEKANVAKEKANEATEKVEDNYQELKDKTAAGKK